MTGASKLFIAAAAMNSLDAPVIGDVHTGCPVGRTQGYELPFRKYEPHAPEADESKKRQDSVSEAPRAPADPGFPL
jgi:hypothetical protein